jgi:integrase
MPRHKRFNPIVKPRLNAKGQITSWFVDCGMIDGKRVRHSYDTKARASSKADELKFAHRQHGNGVLNSSAASHPEIIAALDLLAPHNVTLIDAARFYVENVNLIRNPRTVEEVKTELVQNKNQDSRSPRYLRDLNQKLSAFIEDPLFAGRPVHKITTPELDRWIRSLKVSGVTRNGYKRALGVLFGYAVRMEYALKNPARSIEKAKEPITKPGILTLPEAEALLHASTGTDFVPAIAIGLFCGLRPEAELWHLDWKNINLADNLIDVTKSKNSISHRFVKVSDNLAAWLAPYAKPKGPITVKGDSYYSRLQNARERAADTLESQSKEALNLRLWAQDTMRHTFATMHYAHFKSAAETAAELGHGASLRMMQRHYLNRATPAEAAAYWRLVP